METHEHILAFIREFVSRPHRDRCLALIETERGRVKFARQLRNLDLENRYLASVDKRRPDWILEFLKYAGADKECVLWDARNPAGSIEPLECCIKETRLFRNDAVISCVPGYLAYFQDDMYARYILCKDSDIVTDCIKRK